MALDFQMVLQRGLKAWYQPAKNSDIFKSFSSSAPVDWALFVWLEAWRPFCFMTISCCISAEVNGIAPVSNQCSGAVNGPLELNSTWTKCSRVTMTTPATPVRLLEQQHLLFLRFCHLPSDTFIMIFLKAWTTAEYESIKHTRVLIGTDQQWPSVISNCSFMFCSGCGTRAKY